MAPADRILGPDHTVNPRRALFASVGLVVVTWAVVLLGWRDAPFALTFDDAWYYFGIARNVAAGHGSTFDGIDPTNGYHPLWLAMCVPAFSLGLDGLAAARALLLVQVVTWGAAMLLVAGIVSRAISGWPRITGDDPARASRARTWCTATVSIAFVLFAGNPFVVKTFVNGLESGVAVLAYAALLAIATRGGRNWLTGAGTRWRLGVGLVLALTFLARTDAILMVGCLGLWCVAEARSLRARALVPIAELFGPVAVTLATYMFLNRVAFGIPVQISGLVKRAPLTPDRIVGLVLVASVALAIGVATFRRNVRGPRYRPRRFERSADLVRRTGWFASFCVLLVGYYNLGQTQQWLWYYCPLVLYLLLLLVLGIADFVESALAEAPANRSPTRTLLPLQVILLAPLAFAFVVQLRTFTDPNLRSIQIANRDAGEWIDENLPHDAVLASWDAGVVGYFSNRSVINLDGVVNSHEWYRAGRDGTTEQFLTERGLGWIVNHGGAVDGQDPDIVSFVRTTFGDDAASGLSVAETWPFVYSGVTTGAGGTDSGGLRTLEVFLYRLPSPPAP